jgi:AraC-like DNA-binding protein
VSDGDRPREPSLSVLLIRPCLRLLRTLPDASSANAGELEGLDADARVPVAQAYAWLEEAIRRTGDADLGLKAGRMTTDEDGGVLTYAILSAATVSDAIGIGARYMRLLNDTVDFRLELDGNHALVTLEGHRPLPRAVLDYQASIVHTGFIRALGAAPVIEWWFPFAEPPSLTEYALTFGEAGLRFGARCLGYRFDASYLSLPLPTADPALHTLVVRYADMLLAQLPSTREFSNQTRTIIMNELAFGSPSIERIAKRLRVSARTLRRRLEDEGTTFSDLLNDTRHRLALQYVARDGLRMTDVALLLGFADVATFYRAFKRWTGTTPRDYRTSHATGSTSPKS